MPHRRHGRRPGPGEQRRRFADPHDILRLEGSASRLALTSSTRNQDVYRLQGVKINDKHIEVIVRQMLRRVVITDVCDSVSSGEEQVEADVPRQADRADGTRPSKYESPYLLLASPRRPVDDPFIPQRPSRKRRGWLTEAAISGKRDELRGLKENAFTVGRPDPAVPACHTASRRRNAWRRSMVQNMAPGHDCRWKVVPKQPNKTAFGTVAFYSGTTVLCPR